MNDHELSELLAAADRPVVPPADLSARILEDMYQAAEAETGLPGRSINVEVEEVSADRARQRWPAVAAAAVVVLMAISVLSIQGRQNDPVAPQVSSPTYLRACLNFQTAGRVGNSEWFGVVPGLIVGDPSTQRYLDGLAAILDELAVVPAAGSAQAEVLQAARLARSANSSLELERLVTVLDEVRGILALTTGTTCLDARSAPGSG